MDLNTLYHRTVECWAARVNEVRDDQWDDPTPCAEWTVRDLVNHVVGEDLWTVPLMQGQTIDEVGDRFDGDVLGDRPVPAALDAAKEGIQVRLAGKIAESRVKMQLGATGFASPVYTFAVDDVPFVPIVASTELAQQTARLIADEGVRDPQRRARGDVIDVRRPR